MTQGELLRYQLDYSFGSVRERIEGLTDEEFLWEPVAGCWSLRRIEDAAPGSAEAAKSRCGWFLEEGFTGSGYEVPTPPPLTTIAWKLVHMASCNVMYHEHAFGEGRDLWGDMFPHTATSAIALWEEGHGRLLDQLSRMSDQDLVSPVLTTWGEHWPAWRIFWAITHHDLEHGNEIACLRDLYSHRVV